MADLTVKRGDTWPPIRGAAADENGMIDLTLANSLKFIMKAGAVVVSGAAAVIDPPDSEGNNWQYVPAVSDFSVVGVYQAELQITWSVVTTPHEIETVPNSGFVTIEVVADLGD